MQYNCITLLAPQRVLAVFIESGTVFQSLAVSLLILSLAALDFESSFHIFMEDILISLPPSFLPGLFGSSWNGEFLIFRGFQASARHRNKLVSLPGWAKAVSSTLPGRE